MRQSDSFEHLEAMNLLPFLPGVEVSVERDEGEIDFPALGYDS